MTKGTKTFFRIISLLLLVCVLFLPMFDEGGGILTEKAEYSFVRVIGDCVMKPETLKLWVVHMTACIFAPAVVMLASSLTGIRWIYSIANSLGIVFWLVNFFRLAAKKGFISLFDIHKTDISLGSWLAMLFFLISALVLICTKKKRKDEDTEPEKPDGRCPNCGIKLRRNHNFCPRCGEKIKQTVK